MLSPGITEQRTESRELHFVFVVALLNVRRGQGGVKPSSFVPWTKPPKDFFWKLTFTPSTRLWPAEGVTEASQGSV
jgi:hypothetical protein